MPRKGSRPSEASKRRLTAKQKAFVREYLVDCNATQAALRAGYSAKTASVLGYQLLQIPLVREAIEVEQGKLRARARVTVDDIVEELRAIAFANMADHAQVREVEMAVHGEEYDPDTRKPLRVTEVQRVQAVIVTNTAALAPEQRRAVAEYKHEFDKFGNRALGVKLHDKNRALELLGKHLGMWKAEAIDMRFQRGLEELLEAMKDRVSPSALQEFTQFLAEEMGVEQVAAATAALGREPGQTH
ncbi:MAG TPA: terminase small subunit [Polyangiales bacterium]|nr:terminase small subunit [Polyangiales bacterium]